MLARRARFGGLPTLSWVPERFAAQGRLAPSVRDRDQPRLVRGASPKRSLWPERFWGELLLRRPDHNRPVLSRSGSNGIFSCPDQATR